MSGDAFCDRCGKQMPEHTHAVLIGVPMSYGDMAVFIIKWAFASIPLLLIVGAGWLLVWSITRAGT